MKKLRFKKLSNPVLIRLIAVLTFAAGFAVFSFWTKEETLIFNTEEVQHQVFYVKIPPSVDKNFTNEEILEYLMDYGITVVPFSEFKRRKIPLPNVCGHLYVLIEDNGKIKLNSRESGNIENTNILKQTLETVFRERAEMGVFEENSFKVVRKVMIQAARSTKYGDVVKVIDAVKQSGADPIILQIDDLPR